MSSQLELIALAAMREAGIPTPIREHRFHPVRKWRFDFAWVDRKIAVEIEGGHGGRHQRYYGYKGDCDKYNCAILMGWRLYRFTRQHIADGSFDEFLKEVFENE